MTTRPDPLDEQGLYAALKRAGSLVGTALGCAVGLGDTGAIDLPPGSAVVDQAQLRAIASLYLAFDLDSAGVVPAVEALTGLGRAGGLGVNLGRAAPLVAHFWATRHERATAEERGAAFAQLFGPGTGFDEAMLGLCEALYKLDEAATNATYGGAAQQARVRVAAEQLVSALLGAAGGLTVYMAQEILQSLREALAVLANPDLRGAFGARDTWSAVQALDRMAHIARGDPRLFVRRGKAGMTVLAWLADAVDHLDDQAPALVGLDHPVITAAVDWMQAALAIGEAGPHDAPSPGAPNPVTSISVAAPASQRRPALPASPWAALAR